MSYYNIWEANVTEGILTTLTQASCGTTACSKVISSLINGTAYAFQIAAVDTPDGDTSAYSSAVNVTPVAATTTPTGGVILGSGSRRSSDDSGSDADEDDSTDEDDSRDTDVDGNESTDALTDGEENTGEFIDVAEDYWAKAYIENLYSVGIFSGYAGNYFKPASNVTRAEFVKMTMKMFGIDVPEEVTEVPFEDVEVGKWYTTYLQAAKNTGLISGYGDGTFKPTQNISRAEAVKILLVATGNISGEYEYENAFSDVDDSSWAAPYINYASVNNLVGGYEDGTFKPTGNITRAEAAKIISLMIEDGYSLSTVGMVLNIVSGA